VEKNTRGEGMKTKQYEVKFKIKMRESNPSCDEIPEKEYLKGYIEEVFREQNLECGIVQSIKVKEL